MWAGHSVACALLDGFTGREVRLLVHSNRSALPTSALYGLAAFTVSVRGTSSPTSASLLCSKRAEPRLSQSGYGGA